MNRALSRVGADMAQVDLQKSQLESRRLASSGRVAALENVDLAEAISAMQQSETAYRAALGAVGQGTRVSLMDYLT
jgi:flagellin-like hook-associated protein FlgL